MKHIFFQESSKHSHLVGVGSWLRVNHFICADTNHSKSYQQRQKFIQEKTKSQAQKGVAHKKNTETLHKPCKMSLSLTSPTLCFETMIYPEGRQEKVGWCGEGITVKQILPPSQRLLAIAQQGSSLGLLFHNYCRNTAYWCPLTPLMLWADKNWVKRQQRGHGGCTMRFDRLVTLTLLVIPTEIEACFAINSGMISLQLTRTHFNWYPDSTNDLHKHMLGVTMTFLDMKDTFREIMV